MCTDQTLLTESLLAVSALITSGKERKPLPVRGRADSASVPSGYRASADRLREADKARVKVSLLGQTRGFYLPTRHPRVNPLPPDRRLKLDWVYPSQEMAGMFSTAVLW